VKTFRIPEDLVGEQLNEICFVMDYVELQFNGPILRALTEVVVERDGQRKTLIRHVRLMLPRSFEPRV
jgi:hypothetical protein